MANHERFVILDLDNCISDDEWRLPAILWHHEDFAKRFHIYHQHAGNDKLGNGHLFSAQPPIIIITGRPIMYWKLTVRWLQQHRVPYFGLYMRPNGGEGLSAPELKCHLLHRFLYSSGATPGDIVCAYDDRKDVVEMYWKEGVTAERAYINERDER